jgi:ribosomal protein L13E
MNKARQIGVTIVPKRANQQNINFEVNSPYKQYLNNSLVSNLIFLHFLEEQMVV